METMSNEKLADTTLKTKTTGKTTSAVKAPRKGGPKESSMNGAGTTSTKPANGRSRVVVEAVTP
jgi:hypothetical protein